MKIAFAIALLWTAPAIAQELDCSDRSALPQIALTECAARDNQFWDRLLNDAYQQVIARSDAAREENLRAAQRAWITFRDLTCQMEAADYEGGSIQPMILQACLARLTERRARDLETYLGR
ncbi:lysozyme inhibitor LprI family protein [Hasllibacter sp. MH4015]|uniref:lysozyme inhibitor LprI family protein n=1 Tax=Hasllibacter sp. MH4015 TaxID=2854029 RepID=UPI001CD587D0|nr:lysozyme inhibitor LprI family protein [Hasllibacter sp. MH4015]